MCKISEQNRLQRIYELVDENEKIKADMRLAEMTFVDADVLDAYLTCCQVDLDLNEMELQDLGFYRRVSK